MDKRGPRFQAAHMIEEGHSPAEAATITRTRASECRESHERWVGTGGVEDLP